MSTQPEPAKRITEDKETLSEAYETHRIEAMTEEQQYLLYVHHLDQWNAVPSYVEQQAQQFAREP